MKVEMHRFAGKSQYVTALLVTTILCIQGMLLRTDAASMPSGDLPRNNDVESLLTEEDNDQFDANSANIEATLQLERLLRDIRETVNQDNTLLGVNSTLLHDILERAPTFLDIENVWTFVSHSSGVDEKRRELELFRASMACQGDGFANVFYPKEKNTRHAMVCNIIERIRVEETRKRELQASLNTIKALNSDRPSEIRDVPTEDSNGTLFETFFEENERKSVPLLFKDPFEPFDQDQSLNVGVAEDGHLQALFKKCFEKSHSFTLQLSDDACREVLHRYLMPLPLVNDYTKRLISFEEYFLPSVLTNVKPNEPQSCSLSRHTLLIPLVGGADAKIFSKKHEYALLPKHDDNDKGALRFHRPLVDDTWYEASNPFSEGFPAISDGIPLMYEGSIQEADQLFVPFDHHVFLSPTSYDHKFLRICTVDASNLNAFLIALRTESLLSETLRRFLHQLYQLSFEKSMKRVITLDDRRKWYSDIAKHLDISDKNINQKATTESSSSSSSSQQQQPNNLSRREKFKRWQIENRWKHMIHLLTLPISLPPQIRKKDRNSVTMSWQDVYRVHKNDTSVYGYIVHWYNQEEEQDAILHRMVLADHAKNNRDGDRDGDRDGESNSWELPQVQLRNETECQVRLKSKELIFSSLPTEAFGVHYDGVEVIGTISGLRPNGLYAFTVQAFLGDDVAMESGFSQVERTFPVDVPSMILGKPKVDDVESNAVQLTWTKPLDDGGEKILKYVVSRKRHVSTAFSASSSGASSSGASSSLIYQRNQRGKEQEEGEKGEEEEDEEDDPGFLPSLVDASEFTHYVFVKVPATFAKIQNLYPDTKYQFRVASLNARGLSAWSAPSDAIVTKKGSRQDVVLISGVGHPAFDASFEGSFTVSATGEIQSNSMSVDGKQNVLSQAKAASAPGKGPLVLLSDRYEQLIVQANFQKGRKDVFHAELWAAHHSPRSFNVTAEMILADPPDASVPLHNAASAWNRIVLAERGTVPFRTKAIHAQKAGAIGIVIADTQGHCNQVFDQHCSPGADKSRGEGFAAQDSTELWSIVRIPCTLIHQRDAAFLFKLMEPYSSNPR